MKIGILGGGQLARMVALAGVPLGYEFVFLCSAKDACAASVGKHIHASFDDESALKSLANEVDVITYEFENVPAESVDFLSKSLPVYPPPQALFTARNRLREKTLFNELGIGTAQFVSVTSLDELEAAVADLGLPAILKTCTEGYDGKGQFVIETADQLHDAWDTMGGKQSILESFVKFEREVSIIAVRNTAGEMTFYPLTENQHAQGILRKSIALRDDPMQSMAEAYAEKLLTHLDYVGVLTIEFFQLANELLVNEMAPRVHNSGHWTIEGAEVSQFENHIRAIIGLPLGLTRCLEDTVMLNLIGRVPEAKQVLAIENTHLHLYGKAEREGRKLGHITVHAEDPYALEQNVSQVEALIASIT